MLTVHGRTRFQNKLKVGSADWEFIAKIKSQLNIPVISNGGIKTYQDSMKCLGETKVDGVMSAEGILANPALFSGPDLVDMDLLVAEYLAYTRKYKDNDSYMKPHLFKMLHSGLKRYTDLRTELGKARTFEEFDRVAKEVRVRRERDGVSKEDKGGWYNRYWPVELGEKGDALGNDIKEKVKKVNGETEEIENGKSKLEKQPNSLKKIKEK